MSPALASLESIVPPAIPDYVSSPPAIGSPATPSDPPVRLAASQPRDAFAQRLRAALIRQWGTRLDATRTVWILHSTFLLPDPGRWLSIIAGMTPGWYRGALASADALTNDPVSRMTDYSDLENWALAKGIIIPLASSTVGYLTRPEVQGLEVTALGLMPANNSWSMVGLVPPG